MISAAEARNVVSRTLDDLERSGEYPPIVLIDEHTEEYSWGWVFYWESMRFFETGDVEDMLVGNLPLIVLRRDGSLLQAEAGRPLEEQIFELELALGVRKPVTSPEQKTTKKKKKFSLRGLAIFGGVIGSAFIVAQVGIEAAWYLAIAYFLVAISLIYLKSKFTGSPVEEKTEQREIHRNVSSAGQ